MGKIIQVPYNIIGRGKHNKATDIVTYDQITQLHPKIVVDVGAGNGFYGRMVKYVNPDAFVLAVELRGDSVREFGLNNIYDRIIIEDIQTAIDEISGDLIIFGDVLEHLSTKEQALTVLGKAVLSFSYAIVNTPVGFQKVSFLHKEDEHKCGLKKEDLVIFNIIEYHEFQLKRYRKFNCLIAGKSS